MGAHGYVEIHSDNRLYTFILAFFVKLNGAVEIAGIRQGKRRHAGLFRLSDQFRNFR